MLADYQATMDLVCEPFKRASGAGIMVTAAAGNYAKDIRGKHSAHCVSQAAATKCISAGRITPLQAAVSASGGTRCAPAHRASRFCEL
jgi:hypothetical protein